MFSKGDLLNYEIIESGIENSNYYVTLEEPGGPGEYVLTILEGQDFGEPAYFNELLSHLYHYGLPVAPPEKTLDGMTTTIFRGKPTILSKRLPGRHPDSNQGEPTTNQCQAMGKALAEIHTSTPNLSKQRDNPYDLIWLKDTLSHLSYLDDEEKNMAENIIDQYQVFLEQSSEKDLPKAIVHGDLFPDNTLFEGDTLTGILDFYHACTDFCIEDLAITLNAWCREADASLEKSRTLSMIEGYQSVRKLTDDEQASLPLMLLSGALRFFFTRHLSGEGQEEFLKDPREFSAILKRDVSSPNTQIIQALLANK